MSPVVELCEFEHNSDANKLSSLTQVSIRHVVVRRRLPILLPLGLLRDRRRHVAGPQPIVNLVQRHARAIEQAPLTLDMALRGIKGGLLDDVVFGSRHAAGLLGEGLLRVPLRADGALLGAALGVARVALRVHRDESRVGVGEPVEVCDVQFVGLVQE